MRKVAKEDAIAGVWLKLESLYMAKSLVNRLYLKHALYSFKMTEDKSVGEQIDEFNKLILDLENIGVTIEDKDLALWLLSSLPKFYVHFKDTMLYRRESITIDDVQSTLNSKELNQRSESKFFKSGDGLKAYPKRHKTGNSRSEGNATISSDSYDSSGTLLVTFENSYSEWILGFWCSFHITPNKSWLEEFTSENYETMYLGDNKSCKMVGIGTVRLKLHDGVEGRPIST
uniref:Retrovirus-related Pol polyprotein from transposon TNT 1-94-like beta-barrel domain-containing protein n=1 Tax=Cannabis sativa TaxID=3483 RepID=A0A803NSV0_CANSA